MISTDPNVVSFNTDPFDIEYLPIELKGAPAWIHVAVYWGGRTIHESIVKVAGVPSGVPRVITAPGMGTTSSAV